MKDLTYYEGAEKDQAKHKLDLYLPKDKKDFPVLFFIHGGGWIHGDKGFMGLYSGVGRFYASQGIGAVIINYRLSPGVKHPEHIKDIARAFAWTVKNIEKYGGRPDQIFVCGHSAGGHLVALLATDETYLKAEGVSDKNIKAVISHSQWCVRGMARRRFCRRYLAPTRPSARKPRRRRTSKRDCRRS